MGGGWMTYHCQRCPLILELGGFTAWDEDGVVYAESAQLTCAACGTLHRITEERGVTLVTAQPGPIRATRAVTRRDFTGAEIESEDWVPDDDWQPIGPHPGGVAAVDSLRCHHCGQVGRMLTLERLLYPGGYIPGAPRQEDCPVCHGPMACVGVSDAI